MHICRNNCVQQLSYSARVDVQGYVHSHRRNLWQTHSKMIGMVAIQTYSKIIGKVAIQTYSKMIGGIVAMLPQQWAPPCNYAFTHSHVINTSCVHNGCNLEVYPSVTAVVYQYVATPYRRRQLTKLVSGDIQDSDYWYRQRIISPAWVNEHHISVTCFWA